MTADINALTLTHDGLDPADRRKHPRFPPPGMTLAVEGRAATVIDVSVGGLRVAAPWVKHGARVSVQMAARFPTGTQKVSATAHVVAAANGKASLRFDSPTYALMRFIVHYLAHRHGVPVHSFR